jgi:prepilin-type N-terminal cleavage/methylation domain-containing protein
MKEGFTLVEVMVAVAISALLIMGVSAATQSTLKTAERQKADAREQEQRARAIDVLREDWRGRIRITKPLTAAPVGSHVLILSSTSDGLLQGNSRGSRLITWTSSEKGLSRKEGGQESVLLPGAVVMEFWDGVAWRAEPRGMETSIRVILQDPQETVVLR